MKLIMEGFRAWAALDKEAEPEEELETEEEEDESQEAKLAMLALHKDEGNREQALMMFEMLADGLDLDLLATELDKRLHKAYDEYERDAAAMHRDGFSQLGLGNDPYGLLMDWIGYLKLGEDFMSGGGLNKQATRISQNLYKLGSARDMIAGLLKKTASLWRES